ncbi:MAG: competence/damage-inducible protein A [Elusimicrobia bacterium]|jgi:nicotinamide-nucleotide amidase|nr:competence/damage-inducible protein A [Elusimicrobiota bacterium]
MKTPRVELVCVGTELLMGKLNTHGAYFSSLLEDLGFPLARETTVSDDPIEMKRVFREVWNRASLVVVTGGLGPTFDDLTRDVWAPVCGRKLIFHPELSAVIRERFRRRGLSMPPANRRQAFVLRGARILENLRGTAPGQVLDLGDKILVLLPGPGKELKPMVERDLVPFLRARFSKGHRKTRLWRLFGLPESVIDQRIRKRVSFHQGVTWGILAQGGVVDLKLTLQGPTERGVETVLTQWDCWMGRVFGPVLFGKGMETLESVVGDLLRKKGLTLAIAESCTGGRLAQLMTSLPGSSDVFWGGVVSYSNVAKRLFCGVKNETLGTHGAVSAQVAREMAEGLRAKARSEYVLSVTGIAGPLGGTPTKPVGRVYIGLAGSGGTRVWEKNFIGDRTFVQQQSALWALDFLRRELLRKKTASSR